MAEGGTKCVKYLLFIFNLIFFIFGILLIVAGALLLTEFRHMFGLGSYTNSLAITTIVIGVIVFVVSFTGCFGAIRESYRLIVAFAVLLCIILILEVSAGIAAFVLRHQLKDVIEKELKNDIPKFHVDDDYTKNWDNLQSNLDCCGASNYTDWKQNSNLNQGVPASCCRQPDCNVTDMAYAPEEYAGQIIFTAGCITVLYEEMTSKVILLGGVAAGVAFVQIVGIIFASCLAHCIRKEVLYI